MAWTSSNPVVVGNPTKKSEYDALWDNATYLKYATHVLDQTGFDALAAIAVATQVIIAPGAYAVSADMTIPAYVSLYIPKGVTITVATTKTLTISGQFEAGRYAIFTCTGTGAVSLGGVIYPEWFGVTLTSLDNSANIANAVTALQTNGVLDFGCGTYYGRVCAQKDDITIKGQGISMTVLKLPARVDAYTTYKQSIVVEVGDMAEDGGGSGLGPFYRINTVDFTVDGNYANVPAPPEEPPDGSQDWYGWGVAYIRTADSTIRVHAQNTHNSGIGNMILSDRNKIDTSSYATGQWGYAGLEVHSSNYCCIHHISNTDKYGFRMLANSHGNIVDAIIHDATSHGAIISATTVQYLYQNIFNITVYDDAPEGGVTITGNVYNCIVNASIYATDYYAVYVLDDTDYMPHNLTLNINSYYCGGSSILADYIDNSIITVNSNLDGRDGAQGNYFAIDITGDSNKIIARVTDSATWQVRGIAIRTGSTDNEIVSFDTNTPSPWHDVGTRTKCNHGQGWGTDITAAATISIPFSGSYFNVTGATGIETISASELGSRMITLVFASTPVVSNRGGNIYLAESDFQATSAYDTLTLVSDGTNWREVARSVNSANPA